MSYAQNWAGLSASRKAGIGFVFLWFFFGSQIHFFKTSFDLSIMPPYIPHPLAAVYLSGVLEMIGALGLLFLVADPVGFVTGSPMSFNGGQHMYCGCRSRRV